MLKTIIAIFIATVVICMAGCAPATLPTSTTSTSGMLSTSSTPSTSDQANKPAPEQEKVAGEDEIIALLLSDGPLAGNDINLQYAWGPGNNTLNLTHEGVHYGLERVFGSDRYWRLYKEGGYTWLVDLLNENVQDPLAVLEPGVLDMSSMVEFSPDGKYALISYKSGTVLEMMELSTGIRTRMPYGDGLYSISGHFMDSNTALLIASDQDSAGKFTYGLTRYDIATGEYTEIPGRYTAKDRDAENFMACLAGPWAYTHSDGKVTIVDLRTFEKMVYSLDIGKVQNIFYYKATDSIVATAGETKYLLNTDGTMQAIVK